MKYRTIVEREGELLGPVDWDYNFRQHFDTWGCSEEQRDGYCKRAVQMLREVAAEPEAFKISLSNGYVERTVYAVGMYDGWPYWKPTPALMTSGTLGPEWHFFYDLQRVERKIDA
jgi:hypothetical protein